MMKAKHINQAIQNQIAMWLLIGSHIVLAIAIAIMGAVIVKSNQLMHILQGSKAEPLWRKTRISFYVLLVFYVGIMIILLFSTNSPSNVDTFHIVIMNLSFLLTSILLLNLVNLDIRAFQSLFDLINEE